MRDFFLLKGIPVNDVGLSYMFYEPIFGYSRRMVSTMLDPVSLGHSLAAVFIVSWYVGITKYSMRLSALFFIGVSLFFIFSKGALVQLFLACILFSKRISPGFKVALGVLATVGISLIPNKTGLFIHLRGIYNAVISGSVFGYGVGSVGNYAKMFSEDLSKYFELDISDTYIGALLGQLGWSGLGLWLLCIHLSVFGRSDVPRIAKVLVLSILIVSTFSENTLNFSSFYLAAIITGLLISMSSSADRHIGHGYQRRNSVVP